MALPRPSARCPSCWRRRHRPIRVRGRGTDAQLAAVRRRGQRHVHDGAGAARLRPPEGPEHQAASWRSRRPPTRRTRSARCSSTSAAPAARPPTPSRRRAPTRFPALNEHFDIIGMDPRGVGQSEPAIDCKANQETDGIYSQPFTTPDNLEPRALVAKDLRYIARCAALNREILPHVSTANVARDIDLLRQALGEQQDHVLRLLVRDVPGVDVREPVPAQLPRAWCSTGRSTPTPTSTIRWPPERAERRLRARARALLPGLRRRPGRVPRLRRRRPVGRVRPAGRAAPTPSRSRPAADDPRPVDGDDIILRRGGRSSTPRATGRTSPRRWRDAPARRRDAAARARRTRFYGRNDDGTFDPEQRSLLHDRRVRAALPARRRPVPRARASARGPSTSTRGGTTATTSSTTGCGRSATATRSRAVPGPELGGHAAGRGDDLRPGDAVPRREEPGPRPGQRAAADDARRRPHRLPAATRPASTRRSRPT